MHRCTLSAPRATSWLSGLTLALIVASSASAGPDTESTQGYNGSAVRGYNGSAVRGYNGSAVRGYNGSAVRGYNGSAVRGYNGSAVRGYNGSAVRGYNGSAVRSEGDQCQKGFGDGFAIAAMGPIESITSDGTSVNIAVLGQSFVLDAEQASAFSTGDYVVAAQHSVHGTTIYAVGKPYVTGVSEIRVRATVSAVDALVGRASLGGTTVDYTATLSDTSSAFPEVGQPFEVIGTQPVAQGLVLAGPGGNGAVGCSALDGRM